MIEPTYIFVAPAQNLKLLARQGDMRAGMSALYLGKVSTPGITAALEPFSYPSIGFILKEGALHAAGIRPRPHRGGLLSAFIPRELLKIPAPLASILRGEDLGDGFTLSVGFRSEWPAFEVRLTRGDERLLNLALSPQDGARSRKVQLVCHCGEEPYSGWCYYVEDRTKADRPEILGHTMLFGSLPINEDLENWLQLDPLMKAYLVPQIASYVNRTLLWFEQQERTLLSGIYMGEEKHAMSLAGEPIGRVVKAWAKTPAGKPVRAR